MLMGQQLTKTQGEHKENKTDVVVHTMIRWRVVTETWYLYRWRGRGNEHLSRNANC